MTSSLINSILISKANSKKLSNPNDTINSSGNYRIIIKRDTIIKTIKVVDTVYINKFIEKIVYKEKPEPFHVYGKGNGMLTIFLTCGICGDVTIYIDGKEYAPATWLPR